MPRAFSHWSRWRVARWFDGSVIGAWTTTPQAAAAAGEIARLDVFFVGADIADMRKGEGDDLPGIGGIGEDFLIAGHGRVEADFAHGFAGRAEAEAFEHGAVGKDEPRRLQRFGPAFQMLAGLS